MNEIKVLDKGFVKLVDSMGDDSAIVQAARVSYGDGTKTVREDKGLINYLVKNQHTTPLEMVELKFHIKAPIFVARQWLRHRTASVNEMSARYSIMKDEFYLPEPGRMKAQSSSNKQGSGEQLEYGLAKDMRKDMEVNANQAYDAYTDFVGNGLSRELARISLPVSLYTEWYWKIDLHNLLHFLNLRLHPHAQEEIREYADAVLKLTRPIAPIAVEAWEEHVRFSVRLSRSERKALLEMETGSDAWKAAMFRLAGSL